jgi:hypothetical protein
MSLFLGVYYMAIVKTRFRWIGVFRATMTATVKHIDAMVAYNASRSTSPPFTPSEIATLEGAKTILQTAIDLKTP